MQIFSGLVIPEQIVFDLKSKHMDVSRTHFDSAEGEVVSETARC